MKHITQQELRECMTSPAYDPMVKALADLVAATESPQAGLQMQAQLGTVSFDGSTAPVIVVLVGMTQDVRIVRSQIDALDLDQSNAPAIPWPPAGSSFTKAG